MSREIEEDEPLVLTLDNRIVRSTLRTIANRTTSFSSQFLLTSLGREEQALRSAIAFWQNFLDSVSENGFIVNVDVLEVYFTVRVSVYIDDILIEIRSSVDEEWDPELVGLPALTDAEDPELAGLPALVGLEGLDFGEPQEEDFINR